MHVAITGASSGIGEALAREYFARGARVTLVARRLELLEQLKASTQAQVHLARADLSNLEHACDWVAGAEAALGPIDVLINNAGVQIVGAFASTPWEEAQRLLALDLLAPLKLSQHVVKGMVARGAGTLVDVASMAALAPTPGMAFYNAAKAGLAAASEGLRAELAPSGVHVVTVYPGPVATAMEAKGREGYAELSKLASLLTPTGRADVLARLIAQAVERRRDRVTYPAMNTLARHFPAVTRWVLDRFTPKLRALP